MFPGELDSEMKTADTDSLQDIFSLPLKLEEIRVLLPNFAHQLFSIREKRRFKKFVKSPRSSRVLVERDWEEQIGTLLTH